MTEAAPQDDEFRPVRPKKQKPSAHAASDAASAAQAPSAPPSSLTDCRPVRPRAPDGRRLDDAYWSIDKCMAMYREQFPALAPEIQMREAFRLVLDQFDHLNTTYNRRRRDEANLLQAGFFQAPQDLRLEEDTP